MKLKALSFRQPWASLVLEGRKTLDLRTWSTKYRGPLAVYASLEVEKDACEEHEIDLSELTTGALIGVVDLVDVIPLDQAAYEACRDEHLAGRRFKEGLFGWVLENPRTIEPQAIKGRLNLFDVTIEDGQLSVTGNPLSDTNEQSKASSVQTHEEHQPIPEISEFELRVIPEREGNYRLNFAQTSVESVPDQPYLYHQPAVKTRVSVELSGNSLRAIADQVLDALRQNDYKPTDLSARRKEPFILSEESGVRLGLIFLAIKPLTKNSRVEAISQGIRVMASEELYYWYSKCTGSSGAERAQKALRILLAGE